MPRPDLSRVPVYFHNYINQVPEDDLVESFKKQSEVFIKFIENIPEDKHDFSYAEGKWTLKELLQHIIDAERIFSYRALRFARQDATPLASFDENSYALHSKAGDRNWNDLVEEFKSLRKSTQYLFNSLNTEQLNASGVSNNHNIYVLGIGFITIGHTLHHKKIIEERYLKIK